MPLTREQFFKLAKGVWQEAEKRRQASSNTQPSREPATKDESKEKQPNRLPPIPPRTAFKSPSIYGEPGTRSGISLFAKIF